MSVSDANKSDIEALYRRTAPEVYAFLRRRVGDAAPDLLSEVFVVVWRRREDLPASTSQRAWLFGIARRCVLAYWRDMDRRERAEILASMRSSDQGTAQDDARNVAVHSALSGLKEVDRELIQLTEWEDCSITDAARVLGIKPGTARVRLHRARQRLAQCPSMRSLVGPGGRPDSADDRTGQAATTRTAATTSSP